MLSKKTEEIYKRSVEYAAKVNREEGRAEGKAEGFAEGRAEIAKAMKLAGEPVEKIVLYSGLTAEQVKGL